MGHRGCPDRDPSVPWSALRFRARSAQRFSQTQGLKARSRAGGAPSQTTQPLFPCGRHAPGRQHLTDRCGMVKWCCRPALCIARTPPGTQRASSEAPRSACRHLATLCRRTQMALHARRASDPAPTTASTHLPRALVHLRKPASQPLRPRAPSCRAARRSQPEQQPERRQE